MMHILFETAGFPVFYSFRRRKSIQKTFRWIGSVIFFIISMGDINQY